MPSLALLLVPALGLGCKRRPLPPAPLAPAEAPVPAPAQHLADFVIPSPNALWSHLQRGIGGAAGILPMTFGGLACVTAGLEVGLGSEVDGASPAYGVLALDAGAPTFVVAMRLTDPRRTRDALLLADTARFTPKESGSITVLAPKGQSPSLAPVTGIGLTPAGSVVGYLLVGSNEAALLKLGPYAYRTLPAQPLPADALRVEAPREALAGTLHDALAKVWESMRTDAAQQDAALRAQHGGRTPDFGDAMAILGTADATVQRGLALTSNLETARLTLEADDAAVHLAVTLVPKAGAGPATQAIAALRTGNLAPLLTLPADISFGMLLRTDANARSEGAASVGSSVKQALGDRLRPDDGQRVLDAFTRWQEARGDWLTLAVSGEGGLGLTLRTPTGDGEKARRATRDIVGLTSVPAFANPLATMLHVRAKGVAALDVPGLTGATLATFVRESPSRGKGNDKDGPAGFGVAWGLAKGNLEIALAEDAPKTLAASALPSATLADDPRIAGALKSFGAEANFTAIAEPAVASQAPGQPGPGVVVASGRHGQEGWARIDVADAILREIVKRQTGL